MSANPAGVVSNRMKILLFLTLILPLIGISFAATPDAVPKWKKLTAQTPKGFELRTLTVATYPEHTVELLVYVPKADGVWPCILDIHGGGWQKRQIDSDKPMMERLAQRGFVTTLVSYRLAQEALYPAALHDPKRIGCMGGSAGGHLSGLTAMTSGLPAFEGNGPFTDQSSAVKAAIVMAATQDMLAANAAKSSEAAIRFFGATAADQPAIYREASPITHVRAGVPPTLFIEGERDTLKVGRAEMMEKLRAFGIETGVHTLKHAPHPFWMSDPWCTETVEIAAAFFKKHLGTPQPR
jgi:acetyl esterase/lipase